MIRLCISGIPGTGKSTVCDALERMGYKCSHLNEISEKLGCNENGEVDVDCLQKKIQENLDVAESHYSHFLECSITVILECDPNIIRERLKAREYPESKISENIEVQECDIIYYEALERIPSGRIYRIDCTGYDPHEIAGRIDDILNTHDANNN